MDSSLLEQDLDRQISDTHERLVRAMEARLSALGTGTKERYFGILASLTGKLETAELSLRTVLQEVMAEAANAIVQEMQG